MPACPPGTCAACPPAGLLEAELRTLRAQQEEVAARFDGQLAALEDLLVRLACLVAPAVELAAATTRDKRKRAAVLRLLEPPLKAEAWVLPLPALQVAVQLEVTQLELRVVLLQQVGLPVLRHDPMPRDQQPRCWCASCGWCLTS